MEPQFRKTTALCLLVGSLLATITMILHPSGGSMEHITHIKETIIFSHSMAIFCLPFIGFGSWGLTVHLQTSGRVSMLSFFVFCSGLIAAMIAASINGIVLPYFVERYYKSGVDEAVLKTILGYGRYMNAAMDYIFIAACVFAIGIWSLIIVTKTLLPKWIGYYGFIIIAFGMIGIFTNFNFISVLGFRIFIFSLVSWLVLVALIMIWAKRTEQN
ncbi:hypothetical protein [Emticicia sp. C21]|uniref:hypothetical protein n=1 Tax=Emticicia sp. C21 TaxID=2302915 RepID=UPI000E349012|nr:hypothetical protein [Emticicia sp. C21]RFS17881.1 hypothetical protein D0T08_01145 [Emticicia sp. C21]